MTANKRIFLNIIATYGRSLYAMALGLFTARWVLQALGKEDFGLYGLIGGLVAFVTFFNGLLASSVGRFYAVGVGGANKVGNEKVGLEECRMWFNTALSIHSILPIVLVIAGYPIGIWAIENFLIIPPEKMSACIWVWRFTCITGFVSMINVPFQAMYTAKQEIAELTMYGVATATINAVFIYYMVTHPGEWLTKYAACMCLTAVLPQGIIAFRAMMKYPECKFNRKYLFSISRYKELAYFCFAKFWASFSGMFSGQGQSILVNKYMGPVYNASMTVANQVKGQALTLSSALSGAFWPAIANKAGEGDLLEMRRLCFVTCRFGTVLVLIFALPLCLELHEVLRLWLVTPPDFAAEICIVLLLRDAFERSTDGYWMAIYGLGHKVMKYSWTVGWAGISTVFSSWLFFMLGFGMWSICIGLTFSKIITVSVRLYMGRDPAIGLSLRYWLQHVFMPISITAMLATIVCAFVRFSMPASFIRVVLTTAAFEVIYLPLVWFFVFKNSERDYVRNKIFRKVRGN